MECESWLISSSEVDEGVADGKDLWRIERKGSEEELEVELAILAIRGVLLEEMRLKVMIGVLRSLSKCLFEWGRVNARKSGRINKEGDTLDNSVFLL